MIGYDGCTGKEGVLVKGSFLRYQEGGNSPDFSLFAHLSPRWSFVF